MSREITLQAGQFQEFYEVGDFLRILSAQGPLTIEFYSQGREVAEAINVSKGYAEKFERGNFDRVRLVSATTQAVQFVTRLGNIVEYNAAPIGDTAIVSSVPLDLTAATLADLRRPLLPNGNWSSLATVAALTPLTVFTAAANVNGAIVWAAEACDANATNITQSFLAKATAPATTVDGDVVAMSKVDIFGTSVFASIKLQTPQRIAAGMGLFFISNVAGSATHQSRMARYTLL